MGIPTNAGHEKNGTVWLDIVTKDSVQENVFNERLFVLASIFCQKWKSLFISIFLG